jgi:hypothetical protein
MAVESLKMFLSRTMDDLVDSDSLNTTKSISEIFPLTTRVTLVFINILIIALGIGGMFL